MRLLTFTHNGITYTNFDVEDADVISRLEEAVGADTLRQLLDNTEEQKCLKIAQTKTALAAHLESHPLRSRAHGGTEALYSVTAEKQALLTSTLLMAQGAIAGGFPYEITWNATGQPCEVWTFEALSQLAYEIAAYVRPLVSHQQALEVQLAACQTVEALEAVEIDYTTLAL